jgi:hypothetical protein
MALIFLGRLQVEPSAAPGDLNTFASGVIVNLDAKQPQTRLRGLLAQLQAPLVLSSVQHLRLLEE